MARITGNYKTENLRPTLSVMTSTEHPVESLFSIWHGSRNRDSVSPGMAYVIRTHEKLDELMKSNLWRSKLQLIADSYPDISGGDPHRAPEVIEKIALMCIKANVPASECVHFTFQIDDCTVALREQFVRSKLASYWTQTSRTADLKSMDVNRSDMIEHYGGQSAVEAYDNCVDTIRETYRILEELGVPVEEVRLAPESRVHRIYWMTSLRSLVPIISKRMSWMAQMTLWSPIVIDVAKSVRAVDPLLAEFMGKNSDCTIANGKVTYHKYDNENEDRYYMKDPQPTDPLFLAHKGAYMPEGTNIEFYDTMKEAYIQLWSDEELEVLGWDRNDPSKIGPYDRPKSYFIENGLELPDLKDSL